MITLILIHPTKPLPVNRWVFENESIIRIGRAKDNDIVIYNSVVSRHHLELWNKESNWEVVNFGANGTFVLNKEITQVVVADGMVLRLGRTGPRLLIRLSIVGTPDLTRPSMDQVAASYNDTTFSDGELDEGATRIELTE
ncbi:MAG: FHA domain-containing protein [Microcoleaceae cyanobacterium]